MSVIVYYLGIQQLGAANEIYGTYIWTFQVAGTKVSLWQENSLFFSLPMSFVGFLIGNRIGREVPPAAAGSAK